MILNKCLLAVILLSAGVFCELKGEFEKKHMHEDHEIEVTDEVTFFKLHDLDDDGYWDESDIRAMYGFEGDSESDSDHAKVIIKRVIKGIDKDADGRISMSEYISHKLPMLTKREEEVKEETKKNKKSKEENNNKGQQQKVIVNNKRKSSSNKKEPTAAKEKVFNQKGEDEFIPSKFRA